MKFYPHHIGDYRSATAYLSNEEDICYRRLLEIYYDTERPIPPDTRLLSRQTRVSQAVVEDILREFFTLIDGFWHNWRADGEISKWYSRSSAAKANIEKRWEKKQNDTAVLRANNGRNTPKYQQDTTQDPIPNTQEETKTNTRAPRFDAQAHLVSLGVDEQIASDWITLRRAKKAPPTLRAIAGIANEAIRAGRPLPDVLEVCCNRGWTGFKAEWIAKDQNAPARPINGRQAAISNYAAQAAEARAKSVPIIIERDITGEVIRVA